MDFLALAGDMWNLLIVMLLPLISILLLFIMTYKILAAAQVTIPNWLRNTLRRSKSKRG